MSDLSESEGSVESEIEEEITKKREIIPVNNVPGLVSKLKSIQLKLDWVEKLDISVNVEEKETPNDAADKSEDNKAENDFKREMSFYNQALSAVSKAFKRLKKMDIPTKRPPDFFAEMAKSDSHMNKVREKLLSKQTAIERREQVRAIREQKKHGKKIQQEILRERTSEKKKMLNALKKAKKGKIAADTLLGEKKDSAVKSQKSKKFREYRNDKYGYGGRKKASKWNTAESSAGGGQSKFSKQKKFGRNKPKKHRRRR